MIFDTQLTNHKLLLIYSSLDRGNVESKVSSRTLELPQSVQIESRINFYMCQMGVMSAQSKSNSRSHNHKIQLEVTQLIEIQVLQVSLHPLNIDKLTSETSSESTIHRRSHGLVVRASDFHPRVRGFESLLDPWVKTLSLTDET